MNANERKSQQLGVSHSTAQQRLRKLILFNLVQKANLDICYQCEQQITNVKDLSIEHKIPWFDSDDSQGLFFDLNNIAFSHLKCNIAAGRKKEGKHPS